MAFVFGRGQQGTQLMKIEANIDVINAPPHGDFWTLNTAMLSGPLRRHVAFDFLKPCAFIKGATA
jgi:hypothetical protein